MSGKSIFRSSALAVLAFALAAGALPETASAQERQQRGERGGDSGNGGRTWGQRGDAGGRQAVQPRVQPQVQQQQQPQQQQARRWSGGQTAPAQRTERPAPGSWRGTGNVENGARWGREDRGTPRPTGPAGQIGTTGRPQVTQAIPPQSTARATPQRGWDGTRWNGTNPGRNNGTSGWRGDGRNDGDRNWSRDGNRDNDRGRDNTWNGRNSGYADRDRNRDYRDRDRNDGRGSWNNNNWRDNDRGDHRRWSNDWRRDNRYNWSRYRAANRGFYRLPSYYAPYRGYSYNRLSIGIFLNSGFYGNRYWINDPWAYRLPPAYGSYRWVRYWDDVVLVDIYSGEVVDVIHNFFW